MKERKINEKCSSAIILASGTVGLVAPGLSHADKGAVDDTDVKSSSMIAVKDANLSNYSEESVPNSTTAHSVKALFKGVLSSVKIKAGSAVLSVMGLFFNSVWEKLYKLAVDTEGKEDLVDVTRKYMEKAKILNSRDREIFLNSYVYSTKNLSLGRDNSVYVGLPGGYNVKLDKFYEIMSFILFITNADDIPENNPNCNMKNALSFVLYDEFQTFYNKFLFSKVSLVDTIKSELSTVKKLLSDFYDVNGDKYKDTKWLNSNIEKIASKYDFYNMFKQKDENSEVDKYLKDKQEKILKYLKKLAEPGIYLEISKKYHSKLKDANESNKMGEHQNPQGQQLEEAKFFYDELSKLVEKG